MLETAEETFHKAGFTRESIKGTNLTVSQAVPVTENLQEMYNGLQEGMDPASKAMENAVVRTGLVSYTYGTTGSSYSIDTACSASLAAFNMLHHSLRNSRDGALHQSNSATDNTNMG